MGVVSVTTTVCHGGRSPILFHPIPVFHHPVSSRFSLHGIYPLSLLFFPDIFSSPMWTDLAHARDPYLRSLAEKLPDVVLGARADNTTLTYLNGLRWLKTVSSTYIWMDHYNHSFALDATIMVSKNFSIIGEHVAIIF